MGEWMDGWVCVWMIECVDGYFCPKLWGPEAPKTSEFI